MISNDAERDRVVRQINIVKDRLQTSLSYSLSATKTLAFFVREYGVPEDFDGMARQILDSNPYIDALELTKEGIITNVYPLKGNEAAIGYDVLADPERNREAYLAIEKKALYFAGPFELKQGGMAVVGRLPIFVKNKFAGFSVVLIRLSTLLKAAGLDSAQNGDFLYQLSKINPNTQQEEFFLPNTFPESKGHFVSIEVPDGEWKLYGMLKGSDNSLYNVLPFSLMGMLLAVTIGLFSWHLAKRPEELKRLVEEKTLLSDSIINSLPGIFYLYDRNGKFIRWNRNFELVSGYSAEAISAMHPLDFFDTDEKPLLSERINTVFNTGVGDVTAHFYTRDKKKIPCYFNGRKINFGGTDCLIGMGFDITQIVQAENELRKRAEEIEELRTHLEDIREEERTRISREIHDELGQQLTGLKMDASWIGKRIDKADTMTLERLSVMVSLIDETMKTVRRISSELRPGILDDLGLIPALEWQSLEFERRTGIRVEFESGTSDIYPEKNLSTNIFRIYQEALTNIARHARASKVDATLKDEDDFICLIIKDNGQGFDMEGVKTKNSLGLVGMKERARIFGGEVTIKSDTPGGTVVTLKVPFIAKTENVEL